MATNALTPIGVRKSATKLDLLVLLAGFDIRKSFESLNALAPSLVLFSWVPGSKSERTRRFVKKMHLRAFLGSVFGTALALGSPFAVAQQTVTPPQNDLGGNHNYKLSTNCTPLRHLKVTVNVTQDIIAGPASVPINFQLNVWSLASKSSKPTIDFQQYMLGVSLNTNYGNRQNHPYVNAAIQNFAKPPGGLKLNRGQKVLTLPGVGARLPHGYTLTIFLHNDHSGNVTGATFSAVGKSGKSHSWKIELKKIHNFTPADLAPAVGFELNLVGSTFTSGAGTITYSASTPMTTSMEEPSCVESHSHTAETTNSIYGDLPPGPSYSFTQTFRAFVGPAHGLVNTHQHLKLPTPDTPKP